MLKDNEANSVLQRFPIVETVMRYQSDVDGGQSGGYASWDDCHQFFGSWLTCPDRRDALPEEYPQLHLAAYLAAFGMYRKGAYLTRETYRIHVRALPVLTQVRWSALRDCDFRMAVDNVGEIAALVDELGTAYGNVIYRQPRESTIEKMVKAAFSDTLVTKIVLGSICCVPAYDSNLKAAVGALKIGPATPRPKGLSRLFKFGLTNEIAFKFASTKVGNLPLMRVLDMYLWYVGRSLRAEGNS